MPPEVAPGGAAGANRVPGGTGAGGFERNGTASNPARLVQARVLERALAEFDSRRLHQYDRLIVSKDVQDAQQTAHLAVNIVLSHIGLPRHFRVPSRRAARHSKTSTSAGRPTSSSSIHRRPTNGPPQLHPSPRFDRRSPPVCPTAHLPQVIPYVISPALRITGFLARTFPRLRATSSAIRASDFSYPHAYVISCPATSASARSSASASEAPPSGRVNRPSDPSRKPVA